MKNKGIIKVEGNLNDESVDEVIKKVSKAIEEIFEEAYEGPDEDDIEFSIRSAMHHIGAYKVLWTKKWGNTERSFDKMVKKYADEAEELMHMSIHDATKTIRKWKREEEEMCGDADGYDEDYEA